ncbi:MAG: nitroreductase family protein [Candidatus Woesearchaeota archaeon]
MDVLDCIKTRRSIRKFLQKPIEFDIIARILEAGHFAPSPGNLQNWKFIVVTDKELIKAAYGYCFRQECVYNASSLIVLCSLTEKVEGFYGKKGIKWGTQAVAAAAQNMLLAAHSLGLGAAWIGAFDEAEVRQIFEIPDSASPEAIIALGYADEKPLAERGELHAVVRFNDFGTHTNDTGSLFGEYAKQLQEKIDKAADAGGKSVEDGAKKTRRVMHKLKEKLKNIKKIKGKDKEHQKEKAG